MSFLLIHSLSFYYLPPAPPFFYVLFFLHRFRFFYCCCCPARRLACSLCVLDRTLFAFLVLFITYINICSVFPFYIYLSRHIVMYVLRICICIVVTFIEIYSPYLHERGCTPLFLISGADLFLYFRRTQLLLQTYTVLFCWVQIRSMSPSMR